MAASAKTFSLSADDKDSLKKAIQEFCRKQTKTQGKLASKNLRQLLESYYESHNKHKQAAGIWIYNLLLVIIPQFNNLKHPDFTRYDELISFLKNLPFEEETDLYQSVVEAVDEQAILPLSAKRYLFLVQVVALLIQLESTKTGKYLKELNRVNQDSGKVTIYNILVMMLNAKGYAVSGHYMKEQLCWLDVVIYSCLNLDKRTLVYFLVQWIASLNWLRPDSLRKELLRSIYGIIEQSDEQNKALVLYELFNLPDKIVPREEKLIYLNELQTLPPTLLSVSQLQNLYYFSGSIKSSLESGFMESVSDFKHSNYYIHKYWNLLDRINRFLTQIFTSREYLDIQKNIEQKIKELINLINIQSNAYVETLQSNYTKINELYHQVEELSVIDTLTGLYNRRYLYNNINELLLLAVRQQLPLSFVILDIDDFKLINDKHGHLAGDFILSEISKLLRNYFRKSDFVVRYGGEEFLIVMFNSDHVQTEQALDALRENIMGYKFSYQDNEMHISISIGIASVIFESPYAAVNLEKLISEADAAMYESKVRGKNKITSRVFYY